MALIAWYPLNGDTLDYSGNKNHGVAVGGLTEVRSGKIGNTYNFENNSNGVNIANTNFTGLSEYTMGAWVNPAGNHRNYNGAIISSGNWNSTSWSFGLSQDNTRIDVASSGYNQYLNYEVPLNTWTHILCIAKNNITKVYVNGSYIGEKAATSLLSSSEGNVYIGRETYAGGHFSFNGKINDVRIYDHALSEKEVKEVSRAKILHYTFDDFAEPTENLWNTGLNIYNNYRVPATLTRLDETHLGQPVYRLGMTVDDENNSRLSSFQSGLHSHGVHGGRMTFKANTKYSASILWRPVNKPDVFVGGTASNISGWAALPSEKLEDGWYRHIQVRNGLVSVDRTDSVYHSFRSPSLKLNETVYIDFCCPQIEEGKDHATPPTLNAREGVIKDMSGYGNDAALGLATSPQWINDSKIGSGAYQFNNNHERFITRDFIPPAFPYTISTWVKRNTLTSMVPISITQNTSNYICFKFSSGSITLEARGSNWSSSLKAANSSINEWIHLVAVFNSEKSRLLYVNGKYIGEDTTSVSVPNINSLYVGKQRDMSPGSGHGPLQFNGSIDDVRIYATALSDKDVKELYTTRMSIDNEGKVYVDGVSELYNFLNPKLMFKYANNPSTQTPLPEVVDGRDTWSIYPAWFHPNRALNGLFKEGVQYRVHFTFKHYTTHSSVYRPGGIRLHFTDGTSHSLISTGNSGWRTIDYITPAGKTLKEIAVYYYTSYRVYIDSSSYIREYRGDLVNHKGILTTGNISEIGLPVRYIRDSINGSTSNTSNHWVEIQAIDKHDVNAALGKSATSALLTDGSTATSPYYSQGTGSRSVEVDLGAVHTIYLVKVWHYYGDRRTYHKTKTEVSADGVNWITTFDSSVEGEYQETAEGHTIICKPNKMSISSNGTLYARQFKEIVI